MHLRAVLSDSSGTPFAALRAGVAAVLLLSLRAASGPSTGYTYDPRCTTYVQAAEHPESPHRVTAIHQQITQSGLTDSLVRVEPLSDPLPHIRRVHTERHIAGIRNLRHRIPESDSIGPLAELAVAQILGAVKAVCEGTIRNAFCNIRPPGHHVINGGYTSGFCAYANVVIAARYAQKEMGLERVLIVDWDYHHGNGTVHLVCSDTSILFFEAGSAAAMYEECNGARRHVITVSLQKTGNDGYVEAYRKHLLPAAASFRPQIVLVSSGFDLKAGDALGGRGVTAQGVSLLTRLVMDIAEEYCKGRLVSVLEGGYSDFGSTPPSYRGLAACAEAHIRTLLTGDIQPEAPYFVELRKLVGKKNLR
ncbi:MAG: histone deacetylase [Chitinivibrionales bacterium]|nr:histone deacetylase [Chitinivibrionales bacterium]